MLAEREDPDGALAIHGHRDLVTGQEGRQPGCRELVLRTVADVDHLSLDHVDDLRDRVDQQVPAIVRPRERSMADPVVDEHAVLEPGMVPRSTSQSPTTIASILPSGETAAFAMLSRWSSFTSPSDWGGGEERDRKGAVGRKNGSRHASALAINRTDSAAH